MHVIKRTGDRVAFDTQRIEKAMLKAFQAAGVDPQAHGIDDLVAAVVDEVQGAAGGRDPNVEEIQDVVERHLVEAGLYEVSKRYILYREKRKEARERAQQERARLAAAGRLLVTKRDGSTVQFDFSKIEATLERAARGLEAEVDTGAVMRELHRSIYDGVKTSEIEKGLVLAATSFMEHDPAYSTLASRLLRQRIYREVIGRSVGGDELDGAYRRAFVDGILRGVEAGLFDSRLQSFDLTALSNHLVMDRDDLLTYLGVQTLSERYFVKLGEPGSERLLETPQAFWMRAAMGLAVLEDEPERRAVEFYELYSSLRFVSSTPTLFHSGLRHPQLSSCYLSTVEDDLTHIFKVFADNAQLSKWSGGIGNDWTNIRATGAVIKSTNVESQGVIPFLKIANDATVAINRSGKRRGATCAYLETWHLDIEDFLDLRRNTGDDRRRTHDMNTANWIPDLFMKRVKQEAHWTLFSPDEVPDLHHLYGRAFEERYLEYEARAERGEMRRSKRVDAVKLWRKMLTRLFETGHPWITFKDPSNIRSPQDHVGVVHNSNLCTEITLNNSADETAVCNLGSVNLSRHVNRRGIDDRLLANTIETAMRMLDNVIDINFYPTEEARQSNLRHRPVGLGIMGFQDALFTLRYPMESKQARDFADEAMELVSYHAILGSSRLAAERGAYASFPGSKWHRGIFPIDTLDLLERERGMPVNVPRTSRLDWSEVRKHVATHGMRNSNTMAVAPTATISNIAGCYPCIEPIYKNMYVKANMSGEFTVVNHYLVEDLKRLDLWNEEMLEQIKYHDGDLSQIDGIPDELKALYKEAFAVEPARLLQLTALRGKWIDQSQSHNVFMRGASGKKLDEIYMTAWELGLKTTYYLRTLGASQIEKSTLDAKKYGYTQKRTFAAAATPQRPAPGAAIMNRAAAGAAGNGNAAPTAAPRAGWAVPFRAADADGPATEVTNICSLTDPDCEACQ